MNTFLYRRDSGGGTARNKRLPVRVVLVLACLTLAAIFIHHCRLFGSSRLPIQNAGKISAERRLQNGMLCCAVLRGSPLLHGQMERLEAFEISVAGHAVKMPDNAIVDLQNLNAAQGVKIADFINKTFIMFGGGASNEMWRCKFIIRDGQLVEREITRVGGKPVITRYAPPLETRYSPLPEIEVENFRKLKTSITTERSVVQP